MTDRKSIWDWATSYCGDPSSWQARGELILTLLRENDLDHQSQVLNIGCGNLSEGAPLIRFLAGDHFVGVDPNGWLVEAALQQMPELEHQNPRFLWRSDFDASELGRKFDFIVAHSVVSHMAHWQLDQFLANTRKVVEAGAVMLASFINDQYCSFAEEWVYPGVSTFRVQSVMAAGYHTGWSVEMVQDYQTRMIAACPNDTHAWLRCIAVPSAAEMNAIRLAEEAMQAQEREGLEIAGEIEQKTESENDEIRVREAGIA